MIDAESLMAGLEQEADKLRALGVKIAAELDRGREARITEIDILRPQIMQGLAALNRLLLQCGHVPPPARPMTLTQMADRMRVESNLWSACDQVIALQVPPRARALEATRRDDPSQNSAALGLMDLAAPRTGLEMSLCAAALHAAYRLLLAKDDAAETRFVHLGCADAGPLRAAAALFATSRGIASSLAGLRAGAGFELHEGDPAEESGTDGAHVVLIEVDDEVEESIIGQLAPGTMFVLPDPGFIHRASAFDCAPVVPHLYLAGATMEEAEGLKEAARFTGLSLPPATPTGSSVWQAILDSSAKRGFHPSSPNVSFIT